MVEFKKRIPYNIVISATINGGFKVDVGCVGMFYEDPGRLLSDLRDYLNHPERVEKAYNQAMEVPSDAPDPPRPGEIRFPEPPECTGVFEERPQGVALCSCGASLDAMGRCISDPNQPTRRE